MSASIPQHIGPYRLERSLGQGGMGRVFLVCKGQPPFEARFAMKRMHLGEIDDPTTKALFRQETKVLSGLNHRNIVRAVDFDQDESGASYLVMEYVDGPSLKQLAQSRQLPVSLVVHIAAELCRGLAYCHDFARNRHLEEIVHRDIKPENILIAADGTVKLADFGIAKYRGRESHTATSQFRGTPWYMSPEHMDPDQTPDRRSDLFSLGVVLYELLTSVNPFRRDRANSAEHAIKAILIDGHFTPIEQRVSILEPELCALVNGLLQQDPRRRPQSAQEVLQTLLSLPQRADANELLVEFVRAASATPTEERGRGATHSLAPAPGMVEVTPPPMLDDEAAEALEESGSFDPSLVSLKYTDDDMPTPAAGLAPAGRHDALSDEELRGRRSHAFVQTAGRTRSGLLRGSSWMHLVLAGLALAIVAVVVGRFALGAAARPSVEPRNAPAPAPAAVTAVSAPAPQEAPTAARPAPPPTITPLDPNSDAGVVAEAAPPVNEPEQEVENVPNVERRSRHGGDERLARLNVVVYPWGYIWVDGRYYGESPAELAGLKPGSHAVGLSQSSDKPARVERVRLKPGPNNLEYHLH